MPLAAPFRIATGEVTNARNVLVTMEGEGTVGYGEAAPFEVITGGTQDRVLNELEGLPETFGAGGSPEDVLRRLSDAGLGCDARCAFDVAVHDWFARKEGVALARYLGGRPRDLPTSLTLPLGDRVDLARRIIAGLDAGYRIFKLKSRAGAEEETRRLRLVRDLAGPQVEIRVDANAGWSRAEARTMLSALRRADVAFVEQPLARDDLEGHGELVRARGVPIMLDESVFSLADAKRVVNHRAADLINVKLAKSGGIEGAAEILRFAESQGIRCMVGCMIETRIGIGAAAHVAAAFGAVKYVDLDGHTFLARDVIQGGVRIERGRLILPDDPGHGATPALAEAPVVT